LLQLPDGSWLAESNAMLIHVAEGTDLLPDEGNERARIFQWLFFEQYSHEPYIAVSRSIARHGKGRDTDQQLIESLRERGDHALGVMDTTLARQLFMTGGRYSIADIALYAYTHVADEGGFDLRAYPAVRDWLSRVAERPGHFDLCELAR
jgi:glutathione S-transferase